jgi:hypothetical protein
MNARHPVISNLLGKIEGQKGYIYLLPPKDECNLGPKLDLLDPGEFYIWAG